MGNFLITALLATFALREAACKHIPQVAGHRAGLVGKPQLVWFSATSIPLPPAAANFRLSRRRPGDHENFLTNPGIYEKYSAVKRRKKGSGP